MEFKELVVSSKEPLAHEGRWVRLRWGVAFCPLKAKFNAYDSGQWTGFSTILRFLRLICFIQVLNDNTHFFRPDVQVSFVKTAILTADCQYQIITRILL